jgi:hypothetical protein
VLRRSVATRAPPSAAPPTISGAQPDSRVTVALLRARPKSVMAMGRRAAKEREEAVL